MTTRTKTKTLSFKVSFSVSATLPLPQRLLLLILIAKCQNLTKLDFFCSHKKALKCFTDSSSTRCSSSSCIILINTNSRQRPKKFRKFFFFKILPKRNRKRQNSDTSVSVFFAKNCGVGQFQTLIFKENHRQNETEIFSKTNSLMATYSKD